MAARVVEVVSAPAAIRRLDSASRSFRVRGASVVRLRADRR